MAIRLATAVLLLHLGHSLAHYAVDCIGSDKIQNSVNAPPSSRFKCSMSPSAQLASGTKTPGLLLSPKMTCPAPDEERQHFASQAGSVIPFTYAAVPGLDPNYKVESTKGYILLGGVNPAYNDNYAIHLFCDSKSEGKCQELTYPLCDSSKNRCFFFVNVPKSAKQGTLDVMVVWETNVLIANTNGGKRETIYFTSCFKVDVGGTQSPPKMLRKL